MTAKIVALNPITTGDGLKIDCDQVLECAKGKVTSVVIIGYTPDSQLYIASSDSSHQAVWLMEQAKLNLIQGPSPR